MLIQQKDMNVSKKFPNENVKCTAQKNIFPKSLKIMESPKRRNKYHLSIKLLPEKKGRTSQIRTFQ